MPENSNKTQAKGQTGNTGNKGTDKLIEQVRCLNGVLLYSDFASKYLFNVSLVFFKIYIAYVNESCHLAYFSFLQHF